MLENRVDGIIMFKTTVTVGQGAKAEKVEKIDAFTEIPEEQFVLLNMCRQPMIKNKEE